MPRRWAYQTALLAGSCIPAVGFDGDAKLTELAALLGFQLAMYITVHLTLKWFPGVRLGVEAALFVSSKE